MNVATLEVGAAIRAHLPVNHGGAFVRPLLLPLAFSQSLTRGVTRLRSHRFTHSCRCGE